MQVIVAPRPPPLGAACGRLHINRIYAIIIMIERQSILEIVQPRKRIVGILIPGTVVFGLFGGRFLRFGWFPGTFLTGTRNRLYFAVFGGSRRFCGNDVSRMGNRLLYITFFCGGHNIGIRSLVFGRFWGRILCFGGLPG